MHQRRRSVAKPAVILISLVGISAVLALQFSTASGQTKPASTAKAVQPDFALLSETVFHEKETPVQLSVVHGKIVDPGPTKEQWDEYMKSSNQPSKDVPSLSINSFDNAFGTEVFYVLRRAPGDAQKAKILIAAYMPPIVGPCVWSGGIAWDVEGAFAYAALVRDVQTDVCIALYKVDVDSPLGDFPQSLSMDKAPAGWLPPTKPLAQLSSMSSSVGSVRSVTVIPDNDRVIVRLANVGRLAKSIFISYNLKSQRWSKLELKAVDMEN